MSGLNYMGGMQGQQQGMQQGQQVRQQPRAGISGTTYTPNHFLQNQLSTLYGRMGSPGMSPYAQLGGGYMWQPQASSRQQYARPSPQFPGAPKPNVGGGNPNGYNSEHSGP